MRERPEGMTLIEVIVAGALALVLGLVAADFIKSSIEAHRRARMERTAQAGVRDVMGKIIAELRSSAMPPLAPVASSSVFWPGAWGPTAEGTMGTNYPRSVVVDGTLDRDQAADRLVYTRTAADADPSDPDPLAGYNFVEILVSPTQPSLLERRLHTVRDNLSLGSVTGADGSPHSAWLLNAPGLAALAVPAQPDILFDAGRDARVGFRISHLKFEPMDDPNHIRNPELFDPAVYRIEVAVSFGARENMAWAPGLAVKEHWQVYRVESTELRIPAVRTN